MATRRVWAEHVAIDELVLRGRLRMLAARRQVSPDPEADAIEDGVRDLLKMARDAASRNEPKPWPLANWWRGTLIEVAHGSIHAARAQIVLLYGQAELLAEVPQAVARAESALQRNDPRLAQAHLLLTQPGPPDAAILSKVIEAGYASADESHARVRSFRNIIVVVTTMLTLFLAAFVAYVYADPSVVPLCFTPQGPTGPLVCPTSQSPAGHGGATGRDILIVVLLGLMGGALAAVISLRKVQGTSTPYDVPVVLAVLKVPAGGFSAAAAMIALRGDFVPGLSALDSQEQILAYALVFGYAQQLLTGLLDRQGQDLLAGVPSTGSQTARPNSTVVAPPTQPTTAPADSDGAVTAGAPSTGPDPLGPVPGDVEDGTQEADQDADASDVHDLEPRDVTDAVIVDDGDTVEDLSDEVAPADDGDGDVGVDSPVPAAPDVAPDPPPGDQGPSAPGDSTPPGAVGA